MIRSMTGYGKGESEGNGYHITVEVKTVNNRYLDMNIRLPRSFHAFDTKLRALVKQHLVRGKVEMFVAFETDEAISAAVKCNLQIASQYAAAMREMAKALDVQDDTAVSLIARMPEVFKIEDTSPDEDALEKLLTASCEAALQRLTEAREREGEYLAADIRMKLSKIREHARFIEEKVPEINAAYQQKLQERISAMLSDHTVEESRLLTEAAIFADKSSVDEELVRLNSHIDAFLATMDKAGEEEEGIGRKLDFIVQEMNREANTTLSKSPDLEISAHAVEIKTEIEKIREQIQNIE